MVRPVKERKRPPAAPRAHTDPTKSTVPSDVVRIELPIGSGDEEAYIRRHLDVQLDADQGATLRRVRDGLHARAALLQNDHYVQTMGDAVRWLLEEVRRCLS